ncbi:myogenesis-regulating glycosidase-like isoform X2 [Oppia nitens]|uniref:myogenesis-regulating glycosidase-like isoform X2 n=1 Tax=Oppia nitens TaxID=1686743 RepID=UPI0023DC8C05|nr:myogenesis-regulating glycosidase-like isoform X2 [Oppia nitens]
MTDQSVVNSLTFGNLTINDQKSGNDIELRSNHAKKVDTLVTSFLNANISGVQKSSAKSAKIAFSRDPSGQNTFAIVQEVVNDQKISHYTIQWINPTPNEEYCIHLSDQHWYTTYEENVQRWPIDQTVHFKSAEPFSTNDQFHNPIGGILEYLFIGSNGFALFVEYTAPLFVRRDSNNGKPLFCFSGDYNKGPYIHAIEKSRVKLTFHLVSADNIMTVYRYATDKWIQKPVGYPDERMITYPIWSTWAKYHADITQDKVLEFAKEIKSHGFSGSQIEIDDKWEAKYGDFTFDTKKFVNPKQMVDHLHAEGFRSTLWVYPFVNTDSQVFKTGEKYFIKSQNGSVLVQDWWDGKAAHVDFTDYDAQQWYVQRVKQIRETTGIDSFKFDAGELGWVGKDFKLSNECIQQTPVQLTGFYAETVSELGNMIETRVGYKTQHLPFFVRMLDKLSVWDYNGGLQTLIPTALMMSIGGYSFVLPDMIGGNAYGNFPSKELYIRWLQVNALMPTLQFSITPWDFKESSDEVIAITKAMLKLHEQYSPLIISLAKNAVKTGEPILRPLWWVTPEDTNTFAIDDEFLVGNDLLVAPVTHEKARQRNIYLPEGQWKDHRGVVHKGGQTLRDFKADLNELPYFNRV